MSGKFFWKFSKLEFQKVWRYFKWVCLTCRLLWCFTCYTQCLR